MAEHVRKVATMTVELYKFDTHEALRDFVMNPGMMRLTKTFVDGERFYIGNIKGDTATLVTDDDSLPEDEWVALDARLADIDLDKTVGAEYSSENGTGEDFSVYDFDGAR